MGVSKRLPKVLKALAKRKMKTIKNLYAPLLDRERIKEIILLSAKGKKKRAAVRKVLADIDHYADEIVQMLRNKTYYMLPTQSRTIMEYGKERVLTISPFYPNRILDYIVVESLKPHIRKSMYEYCIGNVDNRGIMYGKKAVARNYKRYKYYLKLDIRKFYPSVRSEVLVNLAESRIKDKDFIGLYRCVIGSCDVMPIGSYYSQWISNWLLEDLDHSIKETMKVPFYVRYVDDMLLMGNNKRKLRKAAFEINAWLRTKGLALKTTGFATKVADKPIDFLGFRFSSYKIQLRMRNFKKLNKRLKRVRRGRHICVSQARSLLAHIGWLKQLQYGYKYYRKHIRNTVKIGTLKQIVSHWDKRGNYVETR